MPVDRGDSPFEQDTTAPRRDGQKGFTVSTKIEEPQGIAASIARRAVELGRDSNISASEAAEHLARLAKGRPSVLEFALAEVSRYRDRSLDGQEYARILLRRALRDAAQPTPGGRSSVQATRDVLDARFD
jgi:hypothetical protein